jgi:hypothetical protein
VEEPIVKLQGAFHAEDTCHDGLNRCQIGRSSKTGNVDPESGNVVHRVLCYRPIFGSAKNAMAHHLGSSGIEVAMKDFADLKAFLEAGNGTIDRFICETA